MKEKSGLCRFRSLHRIYCITSRDFEVCDQGLYNTPNFIKNCFVIGYNIFQLIVSKQIVNTKCIK